MKIKNVQVIGIVLIISGLLIVLFTKTSYQEWTSQREYWEREEAYWYGQWLKEEESDYSSDASQNALVNFTKAREKTLEADAKANECIFIFIFAFFLIIVGGILIIFNHINVKNDKIF